MKAWIPFTAVPELTIVDTSALIFDSMASDCSVHVNARD